MKKVMFQNNLQGISRNWIEKYKFHSLGFYKMLKIEYGCQNMHQTEIWNIWFLKQNVPTEGRTNVSLEMSTKSLYSNSHDSKLIPDDRVTKLITHADTHNTDISTLQEDNCKNQWI